MSNNILFTKQPTYDIGPRPKLYYKLDGDLSDSSGNSFSAASSIGITYGNPGLIPYSTNYAILVSGNTSTINCTNSTDFSFTGDFSVSCWCSPIATASAYRGLVSRRAQDDSAGWTLCLYQMSAGVYTSIFATAQSGYYYEIWGADGSNTQLLTGSTYNVVGVRSGVNMSIYINGKLERSVNYALTLNTSFTGDLYIGRTRQSSGEQFNGYIDDVLVDDRAWSATEVLWYYNKNKIIS